LSDALNIMLGNFHPLSPELNAIIYRRHCKEQLQDIPSEELEELAKAIFEKYKERTINQLYLAFAGRNDDVFLVSGACDVLRERHGEDYITRLIELRKPRTLGERLKYWVTGQMPKYAE